MRPDGTWTYTDRRTGTQQGALTPAQLAQLQQLASRPGLAAEVAQPTVGCADAFLYHLAFGDLSAGYSDCPGGTTHPIMSAIVGLLSDATPF